MKTKFVRVGRSGPTVDGRNIPASMIDQAAAAYDPAVYRARINLEHFRGLLPDGPFRMYGDVLALRAEADGAERVLLAELDITEDLAGLLAKRQKTHWSMELAADFAATGGAYLVGLAVTDSPASLATEALSFAANRPPAPYGAVVEAGALEAAGEAAPPGAAPADQGPPLLEQLAALLGRKDKDAGKVEPAPAGAPPADRLGALETAVTRLAEDADARRTAAAGLDAKLETLTGAVETVAKAQTALAETLSRAPAGPRPPRPASTGAAAETQTDL